MKCRRAFDADLAAVLRGESDDADFLAHHPACPDCAAEVQVWRELEGLLRVDGDAGDAHPEPETLLAFVDAPGQLAVEARRAVEGHLPACRVCTDEIRTLGGAAAAVLADVALVPVVPRAMAAAAPVPAASAPSATTPGPPSAGGWFGRIVWHPAFAYALVAVLLVPLLRDQIGRLAVPARVMDARHEEARQASESTARQAPAEVDEAPAPPPAQSTDAEKAAANSLRDGAVVGGTALAAAKRGTSGAAGAVVPPRDVDASARVEADKRKDAAPAAVKMAPEQPQEIDGKLARRRREGRPELEAAAPSKTGDEGGKGEPAPNTVDGRAQAEAAASDELTAAASKGAAEPAAPRSGALDLPLAIGSAETARAAAPDAGGGAPAGSPTVELRSGTSAILAFRLVENGVILRLLSSADLAPGPIDVHVRGRAGGHELATRVTDRADAIAVRIPPHWLAPGDYLVTLSPAEPAPGAAGVAATLGFTVRAPTSAAADR